MGKGRTAFQKIVDSHCVRTFGDGRKALRLDWVWGHEITTPNAVLDARSRGCDVVFDPARIKTMIDHVNPAKDTASAIQGKIVREWSAEHGIEFLEVGRNGVCHAVIPERGWILPGEVGIMGDSHTCTHGAFCAFTAGVGTTEWECAAMTGIWVCPPQKVIRVNFVGTLPDNVYSKDLILALIKKIGVEGATNAVLEFGGSVIDGLSMDARMTMTNMAVEAGATSGMMMVDEKTAQYLWPFYEKHGDEFFTKRSLGSNLAFHNSDLDAVYDQVIEVDVSSMKPMITQNVSPGDVVEVNKISGRLIDQVYIGSCTNGRIEDLRIAADIFRQSTRSVAKNVRCIIVPATQYIYQQALTEGLIDIFLRAKCFVSGPTCGACLGMSCGVIAPGEVCVSTTNRNFPGRMGAEGMVHLASPATAALSAINGCVSEVSTHLCSIANQRKGRSYDRQMSMTDWTAYSLIRPNYKVLLPKFGIGQKKDFSGKVFYLPNDNVDTDQIIPAKYLNSVSKDEFGKHCLEDAPISADVRPMIYQSQILVSGDNFGCGSSREQAPWALENAGIRCVIATSFARIFENNMLANGLLCITLSPSAMANLLNANPELLRINWEEGWIVWGSGPCAGEEVFKLSDYQKDLIRNGGAVGVMIKLAADLQEKGL